MSELAATSTAPARFLRHHALEYRASLATPLATTLATVVAVVALAANSATVLGRYTNTHALRHQESSIQKVKVPSVPDQ